MTGGETDKISTETKTKLMKHPSARVGETTIEQMTSHSTTQTINNDYERTFQTWHITHSTIPTNSKTESETNNISTETKTKFMEHPSARVGGTTIKQMASHSSYARTFQTWHIT
jgi:hypothetical protein